MKNANVDVAVIGGGAAGLVAAAGTAALGARTVLIERNRLGGECTWTGCVPSKTLLHIARLAHEHRDLERLGLRNPGIDIDFGTVMEAVRATRRKIYEHGETPAYLKRIGIRPLKASARFLDAETIQIERDGRMRELTFRSAIVTTGSRPFVPQIPGLSAVDFLTTDNLFEIDELPEHLVILGGGAVGVEIAQAFARLGSNVTLITRDEQLLESIDRNAAALLQQHLRDDGVKVHVRSTIARVTRDGRRLAIEIAGDGESFQLPADQLLLATGRIANTSGIGLEAAGVDYERHGIPVDAYCRSSVRHVLAAGDVTTAPNLTHVAEDMSKAAALNAVARLPVRKFEQSVVPMVIYTDPEVATVGRSERELAAAGEDFDIIDLPYTKIDRAVIAGHAEGFIRVCHRRGRILGVTIAGEQAGELIAEYALAMRHGLRLPALSETMHAYPTMMLGARRAADQFFVRMLKPWMVRGIQSLFGYRGEIPDYVGKRFIL